MVQNVFEKIIDKKIISGKKSAGERVTVRIDQTLTQDATGTMAYLQLEVMNPEKLTTELSVSYVDHNTTQIGFENFDDHKYLQGIARKYGIVFSRAGNGICHQVHLERFGRPGKTLLGSDSHTPTGGGIGMIAIGAGGLDVAVAMTLGTFSMTYPAVTRVFLHGQLSPWCAAKDVILTLLQKLTTKGNIGTVIEYGGPGVVSLTVPERATITNMGAELGVTTSVFPSDENTHRFLEAQGHSDWWVPIEADLEAEYAGEIQIDLASIEPMVAQPHSPENVVKIRDIAGLQVDQVAIGSCTNSSYKDLMMAARMLKGKTIHENTSLVIAPGSKQVLRMITDAGGLSDLIAAGARIAESACGFCIGNSQAPGTDSVTVRTSNRNFLGRSGHKSAKIYLTSVEAAVAAVIKGELTDPRDLNIPYPLIDRPEMFTIDDSMLILPTDGMKGSQLFRGPNIGEPPRSEPLKETLTGTVTIKVGDKITTDHIMPAGDKLKYRSNIPKYAEFVFAPLDETFANRALKNKEQGIDNFIIAGESYGQGSSREHAALCPMYLGVKVVVAKSIERIHTANLINAGIVPFTFASGGDYDRIQDGDEVFILDIKNRLISGEEIVLESKTRGEHYPLSRDLSRVDIDVLIAGGKLQFLKNKKGA